MVRILSACELVVFSTGTEELMDGFVIVFLRLLGVTATSSDGRDADMPGAFDEERESALLRGTGDVGRGLSSRE